MVRCMVRFTKRRVLTIVVGVHDTRLGSGSRSPSAALIVYEDGQVDGVERELTAI